MSRLNSIMSLILKIQLDDCTFYCIHNRYMLNLKGIGIIEQYKIWSFRTIR